MYIKDWFKVTGKKSPLPKFHQPIYACDSHKSNYNLHINDKDDNENMKFGSEYYCIHFTTNSNT